MKRSILIVFSFCCSLIASAQHTQNLTGLQKNDSLLLKTHRYARFDVSSLMDNIQPPADTLAAIQKTYKEHLAVKTLLIDECIDNQINIQWWQKYTKRMQVIGMGYDAISLFFKGLMKYNHNVKEMDNWQKNLWRVTDLQSDSENIKLYCYIVFMDSANVITPPVETLSFNKLLTDKKFVTHAILFDVNSATIKRESMSFIADLARWLKENPTIKLEIDGHTDNDGAPEANMLLSRHRAEEIKARLTAAGINKARLTTKGFGSSTPFFPNTTPEGKANNRRVEFIKR